MAEGQQQRAVILDQHGARPLNREQRRKLDQAGVEPDEFINVKEWMKPEYKDRPVLRKEFMAILLHYHRQNEPRNRLRVALLGSRTVRWFLTKLFGMKLTPQVDVTAPAIDPEAK